MNPRQDAHSDPETHPSGFEPGEWDRLLEEGENSGPPLDGEKVLAEIRKLSQANGPERETRAERSN